MKKEIIINATLNEVRLAITENGKLAELFIELPDRERSIGNIYLGKVNRIVQGINAAFIDIGQSQDAFLHFSDVDESLENLYTDEDDEEMDQEEEPENGSFNKADVALRKAPFPTNQKNGGKTATFHTKKHGKLEINLEPRQNVIVQIVREAYSTKGVKVSTKIGIPGRYVVLLPFDKMIGISKKIGTWQERKRLRQLARNALPEGFGCIIRTAALNINETELLKDWKSLVEIWREIEDKVKNNEKPTLLYQDMELATSVIRDLFSKDVSRVVVDSKKMYKEISSYIRWSSPHLIKKVHLYTDKMPVLEAFGIEKELETTNHRKINLPSGGSIVIDHTEAMVIIDVNSGRLTTEDKQERNAMITNMEAIKEIARQIRLRDIGGMILIDIIDVNFESNRKKLFREMKNELMRDRAKTMVYPLTQLSIMQITRQRINQNISEKISEVCPTCMGTGRITSKGVISNVIERWLKNFRASSHEFRIILEVHPHMASFLSEGTISRLQRMMIKYFVKIKLQQNNLLKMDDFKFYSVRHHKEITQEYT